MLLGRLLRVAALTGTSPWLGSRPVSQRATPPSLQFSSTFSTAAEAQLEVLSELIRPLDRAAVFARRENPTDGSLEFYPVAVWPVAQGIFLVGEDTPAERAAPSLPGELPASLLLPSYPFMPTGESPATPMTDGGLSVPLAYKSDTYGVLAIWRRDGDASSGEGEVGDAVPSWSPTECRQAERVARTLAVAAALDRASTAPRETEEESEDFERQPSPPRPSQAQVAAQLAQSAPPAGQLPPSESLLEDDLDDLASESHAVLLLEVRAMLAASVHQLNSPLSAVRTLSKLLLRRLDDTTNRELARDILIQAERLSELIQPIDRLSLSLPASKWQAAEIAASPLAAPSLAAPAPQSGGDGGGDELEVASQERTLTVEAQLLRKLLVAPAPQRQQQQQQPAAPPPMVPPSPSPLAPPPLAEEIDGEQGSPLCFVTDVMRPLASLASRLGASAWPSKSASPRAPAAELRLFASRVIWQRLSAAWTASSSTSTPSCRGCAPPSQLSGRRRPI